MVSKRFFDRKISAGTFALIAILLAPFAYAADPAVKSFKKIWKTTGGDPAKQIEAVKTLASSDSVGAVKLLLKTAVNQSIGYRVTDTAFEILCDLKGEKSKAFILAKGSKLKAPAQKAVLCDVIGKYPQDQAVKALAPFTADKHPTVRQAAVENLSRFKCPESVDAIIVCMLKADGTLEYVCRGALRQLTGEKIADGVDWKNWWDSAKAGFDFSKVAEKQQSKAKQTNGKISTSVDGSGLYESIVSKRVLFVVDSSGSMRIEAELKDGKKLSRLGYVQKELAAAINMQLGKDSKFNVLHFGDKVFSWKKKLMKATPGNKKGAINFVKKLKPDGMTNAYDAFKTAFLDRDIDTIYFLTDGTPTVGAILVPNQILGNIRSWNRGRNVKIHTIAFLTGDGHKMGIIEDKDGSKIFMEKIAKENSGFFRALE
jgi:hypothetical protein